MVHIADSFRNAVRNAVNQMILDKELKKVVLEHPYQGFYVTSEPPDNKKHTAISFRDTGIDQDGIFYLVATNIMG